ncbi:MAG: hypothetical protein AAF799_21765 [Myxococcota bacterium]
MPDSKLLLLTALSATILVGCKSGPAKVCAKIDSLAQAAAASGSEDEKEVAMGMRQESSTCVTRMTKMQNDDPETFSKASACIESAPGVKDVVACFFKAKFGDKAPAAPAKAKDAK